MSPWPAVEEGEHRSAAWLRCSLKTIRQASWHRRQAGAVVVAVEPRLGLIGNYLSLAANGCTNDVLHA